MALRSIGIVGHFAGSLAQAVTRTRSKVCVLRGGGGGRRGNSIYVLTLFMLL